MSMMNRQLFQNPNAPAATRRLRTLVLSIACLVALAGCGDDDPDQPAAAPLNPAPALTIGTAQGRPARVVLPDDYDITRRYPLIIMLHGFGADGTAQDFIFHLASRATSNQFILVLPDGTPNTIGGQRFWNATPECCNFTNAPVDDVGYLAALMREAMATYAVDSKRIRLLGHSNGGYMAYRYLCEHPVPVDRIAVLAGSTYLEAQSCADPKPVDVLHMHGTADETILYSPNLPPQNNPSKVTTIGAEAAIDRWAKVAGCSGAPELLERRDYQRPPLGDPAETDVLRYRSCSSGKRVELWRGVGADHVYLRANDRWRDALAAFLSE